MQVTMILDIEVGTMDIEEAKISIDRFFRLASEQPVISDGIKLSKFEIRKITNSVTLQELAHILER